MNNNDYYRNLDDNSLYEYYLKCSKKLHLLHEQKEKYDKNHIPIDLENKIQRIETIFTICLDEIHIRKTVFSKKTKKIKGWTKKSDKFITIAGLVIAVIACILAVAVPEVRKIIGLDEEVTLSINESIRFGCPKAYLIPSNSNPLKLSDSDLEVITDEYNSSRKEGWYPLHNYGMSLEYTITNSSSSNLSVIIQKDIRAVIRYQPFDYNDKNQNTVILQGGCGAGGIDRKFPPIPLTPIDNYEITLREIEDEYTHFVLAKGEPEVFVFRFTCDSPGIYTVLINIYYTQGTEQKTIPLASELPIVCGGNRTRWSAQPHERVIVIKDRKLIGPLN